MGYTLNNFTMLGLEESGHDYFLQVTDARPDTAVYIQMGDVSVTTKKLEL